MTIETAGKCPKCGNSTNTRYGLGWYTFDSCPNCGFGQGIDSAYEEIGAVDVFENTLNAAEGLLPINSMSGMKRLIHNAEADILAFIYDDKEINKVFKKSLNSFFNYFVVKGNIDLLSDKEIFKLRIEIKYLDDVFVYIVNESSTKYYFNGLEINLDSEYKSLDSFILTDNFMPVIFAIALSKVVTKIEKDAASYFQKLTVQEPAYENWIRTVKIYKKNNQAFFSVNEFSKEKSSELFYTVNKYGVHTNLVNEYKMKKDLFKIHF